MYDILKMIYRYILQKLPDKFAVYIIYFRGYHKILNLQNPKYFGEKIQWLKLNGQLEELSQYVDKYEVRKFVKNTIGDKYLNKLYGLYESEDDIDFDALPDKFVLKCTNGSGMVLICKNKSDLNIEHTKKLMHKWLIGDYSKIKKEPQYKYVRNRITAEAYLEDDSGALRDYKFYCYDGIPYYYGIFTNRYTDETVDMYDMSGKRLLGVLNGRVKNSEMTLSQQANFKELCEVVKKLAAPFQFVRVDFYTTNGKLYFGELTFTDGAGSDPFSPLDFDIEMAKRIKTDKEYYIRSATKCV